LNQDNLQFDRIQDSKGSGEIVNITRQKSALIRWSLTRHVLADFSSEMKERSGSISVSEHTVHDKTKPACLKRDEEHVQLLLQHLQQSMTDPFNVTVHPNLLINILTGMHTPKDIEASLTKAFDNGATMAKSFVSDTLSEGQNGNFFGSISHSKLKHLKT
jgi:hypothetical protein